MNRDIHYKYWNKKDEEDLQKAQNFADLWSVAKNILNKLDKIGLISGPISTGGTGNRHTNGEVFKKVIELMSQNKDSIKIFSQFPFEDKMATFYFKWRDENPDAEYCMPILDDFYKPLFESGKVCKVYFIHGFESSFGARWEHELCKKLNIEMEYLPRELTHKILKEMQ